MRFGLCTSVDHADAALAAGFDYVELPASQLIERLTDFDRLRPEATNLFFPAGMRAVGEGGEEARRYAANLIPLAASVGVRTMVIGSAGARRAEAGQDPIVCQHQFVDFAREVSALAEPFDVVIAPESLNRTECNVGVSLAELAAQLRDAGVAITVDGYHVLREWDLDGNAIPPPAEFWREQIPFLPAHVHLGSRQRVDPVPGDPDLIGFVERLGELGYGGRVSLECGRRDGQALENALADLRNLFGTG